jgi:hypothetical protein
MRLSNPNAFVVLLVLAWTCAAADQPDRARGISVHMLPKRVADQSGQKWGFVVSYGQHLRPEAAPPVLQSPNDILSYVRKQEKSVQQNGLWIVTSNPAAYSEPENALLADVKVMCHREHIPLFIARGSELPDGWHRYDQDDPK